MSRTHDDDAPVEHDPTGMRALLAGLPDPGPMPDDLVARISAALSAEAASPGLHVVQDALDAVPGPDDEAGTTAERAGVAGTGHGSVVPLRRRPWGRHLAVAAAVVAAVGLGGVALQVTQGGLTAAFDASSAGGDSGAGMEEGAAAGQDGSAPQRAPAAGSSQVVVVLTERAYSSSDLAAEARRTADAPPQPLRDLAAEAPSLGPVATPIGARSCADALGISPTAGLLVDLAVVDDRPAAVIIATDDTGRSAWAVARSCTTGTTGLISGPVGLD